MDSKTLAAARRAVTAAAATSRERDVLRTPRILSHDESHSVLSSHSISIPGTPSTPPPPHTEPDDALLPPTRGVDRDIYFQALHAERERVNAEVARMDAEVVRMDVELAHLHEEYAHGAPPTYFSDNGSDRAPAEQPMGRALANESVSSVSQDEKDTAAGL
jgi:hypothetical protein